MDIVQRRLMLLLAAVLPGLALAEPVVVFPAGPVAAWPIKDGAVVMVGQKAKPQIMTLPAGATAQPIEGPGYTGVVLTGLPKVGVIQAKDGWQLSTAAAALQPQSALLLNQRWNLGGAPLVRVMVDAAGSRWEVGLTRQAARNGTALAGVVRRLGALAAPVKAAPEKIAGYAAIEPAAGLQPTATPGVDVEALVQDVLREGGLRPLNRQPQTRYTPGSVVMFPEMVRAPAAVVSATEEVSASSKDDAHAVGHAVSSTAEVSGTAAQEAETTVAEERTLPAMQREVIQVARNEVRVNGDVGVLIPVRGTDYMNDVSEALQLVAEAPVGSAAAREARLALAGVYLAWQRPEEAMAVLAASPARADGLPAGAVPRLLWGVAALGRGDKPGPAAFDQEGELAPHAALWAAVAANARGDYHDAATQWPSQRGILPEYPDYLRSLAQQAQANALVMTGQNTDAMRVLEALETAYGEGNFPPALLRLKGLAQLGSDVTAAGLESLAAAAENTTDLHTAVQAKLEFVMALHRRKEISDIQLRGYLRDLQEDWRGDETERQTLSILADLYDKAGEPNQALLAWQTLLQAFPRTPEVATVTARMAQAFIDIFDPESDHAYDALTYLGLYYDFRELLPLDERGDLVQERMVEALMDANLFERAVPILEQQLQYRALDDVAKGRLALLLARAYRNLNKPEESLKVLESYRAVNNTQTLRRGWALEEAEALANLNRPQAAAKVLAPLFAEGMPEDKEAAQLAAQVAWQGQDWPNAAAGFQRLLAKVPSAVLVSDTTAQLNTFRLAYALAQAQNAPALANLKARYAEAWPRLPRLADDINAVAASRGVEGVSPEGGPLQALTTALSQINSLDSQIAQTRRKMQRTRDDREEYNRRMQYMELLPPPAL